MPARAGTTKGAATWWLLTAGGALIGAALRALFPSNTQATHYHDPHVHISSINSYADAEDFCVELVDSPQIEYADAVSAIVHTLMLDNPGGDWHRLDSDAPGPTPRPVEGNKVSFATSGVACDQDPNVGKVEIRFWVRDYWAECGGWNCVLFDLDDPELDPVSGHVEYPNTPVRVRASSLSAPHVTVNHEMGHVLNLRDPDCVQYPSNPGTACEEYPGLTHECGTVQEYTSVMHEATYYGCSQDYEWPQPGDWESVLRTVEGLPPAGGGGNFNKF